MTTRHKRRVALTYLAFGLLYAGVLAFAWGLTWAGR